MNPISANKWSHLVLNWFPGHMAKGTRNIKEMMGSVNIIVEVRDARVSYIKLLEINPIY